MLLYKQVQCIHRTYKLYSYTYKLYNCTYKLYGCTVGLSSHPAMVCTFSKHTQYSNKIQEKVFGYIPPGCNYMLSKFLLAKAIFWKFRYFFLWTVNSCYVKDCVFKHLCFHSSKWFLKKEESVKGPKWGYPEQFFEIF